jgi:hypothetical protein
MDTCKKTDASAKKPDVSKKRFMGNESFTLAKEVSGWLRLEKCV